MTLKVEDTRSIPEHIDYLKNPTGPSTDAGVPRRYKAPEPQYDSFTPILDRVLIRRVEDVQKSKLGVPDKYRQHTNKGEVIGVGELVKSNLKRGDLVLFGEYSAERFEKDGEELWLVREANIRGVERIKTVGIPLGVE